jgi:hypothetical protein
MHELTCPDKAEVRRMIDNMRRNYTESRERSRSRERGAKVEEAERAIKVEVDDEDEMTLSDCEDCQNLLRNLNIEEHPKLKKYLIKYEEYSKIKFES